MMKQLATRGMTIAAKKVNSRNLDYVFTVD